MESENFTAARQMVKRLETEIEAARRSWAIFSAANGKDEHERKSLREALRNNQSYAANAFGYVINTCATNTVLALARITDQRGPHRNSLDGLKGLVGPIQREICDAALHWYQGIDFAGSDSDLAKSGRTGVASKLPMLISGITDFLKGPEVERIRNLRNDALAHALLIARAGPTYTDIELAFQRSSFLVSTASYIVDGRHWEPEDFNDVTLKYANDFWDAFEAELRTEKSELP